MFLLTGSISGSNIASNPKSLGILLDDWSFGGMKEMFFGCCTDICFFRWSTSIRESNCSDSFDGAIFNITLTYNVRNDYQKDPNVLAFQQNSIYLSHDELYVTQFRKWANPKFPATL